MEPTDKILKMQKMEKILSYIIENLDTVKLETCAEDLGYNKAYLARIFREYYDLPFLAYVKKLRLRRAAQSIYDNQNAEILGANTGYNYSSGFSAAFTKEFGVSPRTFLNQNMQVPDMPIRKTLFGLPITLEYYISQPRRLAATFVYPEPDEQIDLMEDAALGLERGNIWEAMEADQERVGIWWMEPEKEFGYAVCRFLQEGEDPEEGEVLIELPSNNYVNFSIPKTEDKLETLESHRALVQYAFLEWMVVNRKITDQMGITLEHFTGSETSICIPLVKGMYGYETLQKENDSSDEWITYINDHITSRITTRNLAEHFHYSETVFRSVFYTRFGLSPAEYMSKRRLIAAAEEIEHAPEKAEQIAERYGYHSRDRFSEEFYNTFETEVKKVEEVSLNVISLPEYYEDNKDKIRISYEVLEDFQSQVFRARKGNEENVYMIPKLCDFWFKKLTEEKDLPCISLWMEHETTRTFRGEYRYFIGTCLEKGALPDPERRLAEIKGGKYARFETLVESDEESLADSFSMLEQCAFHGWIKENRIRYDESRITFVIYKSGKLFFYVPIKK